MSAILRKKSSQYYYCIRYEEIIEGKYPSRHCSFDSCLDCVYLKLINKDDVRIVFDNLEGVE